MQFLRISENCQRCCVSHLVSFFGVQQNKITWSTWIMNLSSATWTGFLKILQEQIQLHKKLKAGEKTKKQKPKQLHLVRWKPSFFFWAIRGGGFFERFHESWNSKAWLRIFLPKNSRAFCIPSKLRYLSDFHDAKILCLFDSFASGGVVGYVYARDDEVFVALLDSRNICRWLELQIWYVFVVCQWNSYFTSCDHVILDIQTSFVWALLTCHPTKAASSTVEFDSGYVNTASNLEILAQLVPFLISWPNEGVQQMMLGRVSKCVGMLGCFLLFFYALYL